MTRWPDLLSQGPVSAFGDRRGLVDDGPARLVLALSAALAVVGAGLLAAPLTGAAGLLGLVFGGAVLALLLGLPEMALALLMLASFTRLAIQFGGLPAEPMTLILAVLVLSCVMHGLRGAIRFRFGALEAFMGAYLLWNVVSALLPHELPAIVPTTGQPLVVYRFILSGTVLPFVAFIVARALLRGETRIRRLMVALVGTAVYSSTVSILQFTAPELVWPRYIAESPTYLDRAVGIFNQPVVNGLVMVVGFITALFLAQQRRSSRRSYRLFMGVCAVACLPGVYLTRTRAVWLALMLGVLLCALVARRVRAGFVATLVAAALFLACTWSTFTSADRDAGGIGSTKEVDDRLNTIATSMWAIEHKPVFGWGIARFAQVNAEHHQRFGLDVDYTRGFAIPSHENELGIAAELGLFGLGLWVTVLVLLIVTLVRAVRRLPRDGLAGRALGLLALIVLATWMVSGFTVDLRYLDYANLLTFVLVGSAVGVADGLPLRASPRTPVAPAGPMRGRVGARQ
jgi:O-antigen ligase